MTVWIVLGVVLVLGAIVAGLNDAKLIRELEEACKEESNPVVRQQKYAALARYKKLVMEAKVIANEPEKQTLIEAIKA